MAQRQTVTVAKLAEAIVAEANRIVGHDSTFLAHHIKVSHRRDGEPNWDATLDFFGGAVIADAFHKACEHAKPLYEVE